VTPFRFEHEFRAPSPAAVFEAYFDPECTAESDRRCEVSRRDVLEHDDRGPTLHRVCRVVPRRQLPAVLRPFVKGDLTYTERLVWHKAEDRIDISVEPAVLEGRIEWASQYRLVSSAPDRVRRTYSGHVSVQVRLLGARIERGIIEDLERTLVTAAACTQEWLDAKSSE
jgi:hypothetical protein